MKKLIILMLSAVSILLTCACIPQGVYAAEQEQNIYGIGSVSKMFGAAAVMKLVDLGKVELDTPVVDYIKEFQMADERYKQITVRMLLNHSSGIMGTTDQNCFLLGKTEINYHTVLLDNLKTQKLKADPGEYSVYCNDGFTLAEIVVERVSGMSFAQFIQKEFTEPLGMEHTFMPSQTGDKDFAPIFYKNRELPYENIQSLASGGIYSTPEDLCRFSRIFTENGCGILSQKSVDAMRNPEYQSNRICVQQGESNFGYGLGWDSVDAFPFSSYGITALSKGGDTGNYCAGMLVLPEQKLSVCVTGSGGVSEQSLVMAKEIITEVLIEEGIITEDQERKETIASGGETVKKIPIPEELKKYAGFYASGEIWKLEFTEEETARITALENNKDMIQEYSYAGDGKFISSAGKYISYLGLAQTENGTSGITEFHFSEEPNGKTYLLGTSYIMSGGKTESAITAPFAEKIEENTITDDVSRVWKERSGRKYYLVNEIYNSGHYLTQPYIKLEILKGIKGYTGTSNLSRNCRILDKDNAVCDLDLPVMTGRDLTNYYFLREEGKEYLKLGGGKWIGEEEIPELSEIKDKLTLGSMGEWYQIGENDAGSEIKISIPKNSAYYIYDKDNICIASSLFIDEKETILLPKGGKVLLAGQEGSTFTVVRQTKQASAAK